jgi:hypothetical protein
MAELVATPEAYREAVETGLLECGRLADAVGSMRDLVRAVMREAVDGEMGAAQ